MRLLNCEVTNFASYRHFEFDFQNLGLSLIYGPTGAGKSTICDIAYWMLFGQTAKGGNVDEVRSWQTPDEPTKGTLNIEVLSDTLTITRIRGKTGQNDLYWTENGSSESHRGKDLAETQHMLETRLGVSADLYLTAAYFQEFSATGAFFTAKAKDRREVFEKIANLDLPVKLNQRAAEERKEVKKTLLALQASKDRLTGKLQYLNDEIPFGRSDWLEWENTQTMTLRRLRLESENFDSVKASKVAALELKCDAFEQMRENNLRQLSDKLDKFQTSLDVDAAQKHLKQLEQEQSADSRARCSECGGPKKAHQHEARQAQIKKLQYDLHDAALAAEKEEGLRKQLESVLGQANPFPLLIEAAENEPNQYKERIEFEMNKINPYRVQVEKLEADRVQTESLLKSDMKDLALQEDRFASLVLLSDLSGSLRAELLKKAVQEIQDSTNAYLDSFFEAELRVQFSLNNSDDLDVEIQKSGNACVYRQLSKGQRGLLKLCFSVSVMAVAENKAGTHFANLFLDEALDGLDSELKIKAFGLFERLAEEHETIVVIDHSPELHQMFPNRYKVSLIGDTSVIEHENES